MFSLNLYKSGDSLRNPEKYPVRIEIRGQRTIGNYREWEYELCEPKNGSYSHRYRFLYGKFLVKYPGSVYLQKKIVLCSPRMFLYLPIKYKTPKLCLFVLRNCGVDFLSEPVQHPKLPPRLLANTEIFEYVKHLPCYTPN